MQNVPSFAAALDQTIDVAGLGDLQVHTAYGGDSFVVVDAQALGFAIEADEAHDLARIGTKITQAANDQLAFTHPEHPEWTYFSFCLFAGPISLEDGLSTSAAVAIQPGKIDRSPTGTALCARMAILHAQGLLEVGETLSVRSIIHSTFRTHS